MAARPAQKAHKKHPHSPMAPATLDRLRRRLPRSTMARGASIALLVRPAGLVFTSLLHFCLARWLSASGYGSYVYIVNLLLMITILSELGFQTGILRFTAAYVASEDFAALRGLILRGIQIVASSSVLVALAAGLIAFLLRGRIEEGLFRLFLFSLVLIPIISINQVQLEAIRGLKRVFYYLLPEQCLLPLFVLVFASVLYLRGSLDYRSALFAYGVGRLAVLLLSWVLLRRLLPQAAKQTRPAFHTRQWLGVSLDMLLAGAMQQLLNRVAVVLLGALAGMSSVGIYNAAVKLSTLNLVVLRAIRTIAAPMISECHARGDKERLQALVTRSGLYIFIGCLPVCLVLILMPSTVMGLFGVEFREGATTLLLLMIGQLVNSGTGIIGSLLTMTGHQRKFRQVVTVSAILNAGLNCIFIPLYGMNGAAAVTSLTMILWNVWMFSYISREMGIRPGFWHALRARNGTRASALEDDL